MCPNQKTTSCEIEINYTTRHGLPKKAIQTINIACQPQTTTTTNTTQPEYTFTTKDCFDTALDPIPICSLSDLNNIRNHLDKDFILMTDIDATLTNTWNGVLGWEPIGSCGTGACWDPDLSYAYTGNFNGNNKVIKNLFINRPAKEAIGLFGHLSTGTISNLGLINANITGGSNVGGLAGLNNGTIQQVYTTGNIVGTYNVGGINGTSGTGVVQNSYNTGNINGLGNIGGICGSIQVGSISNTYNTGTITANSYGGGNVGSVEMGTATNSFNVGNVIGNSTYGLTGSTMMASITQFYWDTYLSGQSNCYSNYDMWEMITTDLNTGCTPTNNELSRYYSEIPNTLGWPTDIWTITSNALPKLAWE